MNSEENKSSSGTSESERLNFKLKLSSYIYPLMPKKNKDLRIAQNNNVLINSLMSFNSLFCSKAFAIVI